jgi:transposase
VCYWSGMERKPRVRSDYATEQRRRVSAGQLFGEGLSPAEVGRRLGVSRQAATRWHHAWRADKRTGLTGAGHTGRPRKLSADQRAKLSAALLAGAKSHGYRTEMWTLRRIAAVIRKRFRVTYHPGHVWRVLGELGWSCQRPEGRARERDEAAIRRWLRRRWPGIKKRRPGRDPA